MNNHSNLSPIIFKHWLHADQEDTQDIRVYRPKSYDFPDSRGREGFEFKANGEFIRYDIIPACGLKTIPGVWQMTGENRLRVSFYRGGLYSPYTMHIFLIEADLLKIRLDLG
jgi:hypothetical protein